MKNLPILVASIVVVLVALNLTLKPYLHKRSARKVVDTVLTNWGDLDILRAMDQWENPSDSPPMYGIVGHNIVEEFFYKEGKRRYAKIYITLNFQSDSVYASGKEWIFELRESKLGWKVFDFYAVDPALTFIVDRSDSILPTL